MSLFDSVISGNIKIEQKEEVFSESVENDVTENIISEAVYPESLKPLLVMQKKITLPRGNPIGKGWMCLLYSPNFEASIDMINSTVNLDSGNKYYYYFYMMMYRGMIYNKRYRYRNFTIRKELYDKIKKNTNVNPYVRQEIDARETRNIYFELCTYLNIFNKYSYKMPIPRRIVAYWMYLKPVLQANKQYKKLIVVDMKNYPLKKSLKDNLSNPLYMIYYTLFNRAEVLKEIDVDFLFYANQKVLRLNPSKLSEADSATLKIRMGQLMANVPKEVFDEKKLKEEELVSVIVDDTKKKLGVEEQQSVVDEKDVVNIYMQPTKDNGELEKSIETAVSNSMERIVKDTNIDATDMIRQESKVKAVVQMQVDNDINEDRKILENAYNKMKHEKMPSSPRSTARDQKLLEEQKNLTIAGMTVEQLEKIKANTVKVKPKDVSKSVETPNKAMTTSSFYERNKTYINTVMPKDIMNVFLSLNNKSIPLFIRDINVEDTSDELNYKETYTVHLEDSNRQRHTIKVDLPKIVENRFLYLGGGKKNIKNQNYFFPVVKTKPGEVQMVSNYNKMYINRHDTKSMSGVERLKRLLKQEEKARELIRFGNANSVNKTGEFITTVEFDELAKFIKRIKSGSTRILFNQFEVESELKTKNIKIPDGYFCVGFRNAEPIFVKYSGNQKTDDGKSICDLIIEIMPEAVRDNFYKIRSPKRLMVAEVRVMNQTITVAMLLGFWEGIETLLRKCNAVYRLEDHMPKDIKPSENVLRFKDTFLVYEDTMETGLLLNGIRIVNTEQWNLTDFNTKEPYMEYFIKVYGKASIANALLNFYEWFIDPVTKEILEDINLTTDMVSLTIYAVSLLADSQHSSILNQRISRVRNFEIIPMVLYGVLAKHYVTFRNSNGRKKYAIPRDAVIKDLLSVVTVEETSTLNPTLEMETTHGVSFKGFHGNNLDDMYTIATRSYDKSMTGIIAPSSPPDAGCGLNKMLSLEPNITNIRGYAAVGETDAELNKLEDVNLFSPGELSMPGAATIDDPSRLGEIAWPN